LFQVVFVSIGGNLIMFYTQSYYNLPVKGKKSL